MFKVNDFLPGRFWSRASSLTLDAITLGESKKFCAPIETGWNPLSTNGLSFPFWLLPVTVLTEEDTVVNLGLITWTCGVIISKGTFYVALLSSPPVFLLSLKYNFSKVVPSLAVISVPDSISTLR